MELLKSRIGRNYHHPSSLFKQISIKSFERASHPPLGDYEEIQGKGELPIYFWCKGSDEYLYYSLADIVVLPSDSSNIFLKADLKTIDFSGIDTSEVTNFCFAFSENNYFESENVLSFFDTSNVVDMTCMFANNQNSCLDFEAIENWKTDNLVYTIEMFKNNVPGVGNLDLSKWNTKNLQYADSMFAGNTYGFSRINLANWDTSSLKSIDSMFADCKFLESINLTGWKFFPEKSSFNFLEGCENLREIIGLETIPESPFKDYLKSVLRKNGIEV